MNGGESTLYREYDLVSARQRPNPKGQPAAHQNQAVSANADSVSQSSPELRQAFEKFMQNYVSTTGQNTLSSKERELLFARFMKMLAESKAERTAVR